MSKVIVWDWDGTLVDSFETIRTAYNAARTKFGLPAWSLEETHINVALSGRDVFPKMFGENAEEASTIFYKTYEEMAAKTVVAKPDRGNMLERTSAMGIEHVIVSNKRGDILREECEALGWNSFFKAIVGAGDAVTDKPSPAPVTLAYEQANIKPDASHIMIGDTPVDGHTAKAAGIKGLLLSGETREAADLEGEADYIMEYKMLEPFLQKYWGL